MIEEYQRIQPVKLGLRLAKIHHTQYFHKHPYQNIFLYNLQFAYPAFRLCPPYTEQRRIDRHFPSNKAP